MNEAWDEVLMENTEQALKRAFGETDRDRVHTGDLWYVTYNTPNKGTVNMYVFADYLAHAAARVTSAYPGVTITAVHAEGVKSVMV